MRRREFMTLLGGAAAWPSITFGKEVQRRVGVLMNVGTEDPHAHRRLAALEQELGSLGWTTGRNLQIDQRWAWGSSDNYREAAAELLSLKPDVVVVTGAATLAMQRASKTVPIVFAQAVDPVGAGFVTSLARPRGNATGFMQFEYSLAGKWLQMVREIDPTVRRVGVVRDPSTPAGIGQWAALQVAAEPIGVELFPLSSKEEREIESGIADFAVEPNGALIIGVGGTNSVHRKAIIANAARHRLVAIYAHSYMAADGGLLSYGVDLIDQYRHVARYVNRILKGEKPSNLPVQKPTRYELTINMKTAKALNILIPSALLARADEVIE